MSLKDEYFARMISQFRRWDAEFGVLSQKAGQMSEGANAQFDEQLKAMRMSRDAAFKNLQEIRTASESGWRAMESALDTAWASMRIALDTASARSKKQA